MEWNDQRARSVLREMFDAAIASAAAGPAVLRNLPEKPKGRCVVIGAGKASAAMAAALNDAWPDVELSGVVVTRYGHAVPAGRIRILEAAHPVPDRNSVLAAQEIQAAVQDLTADDLVIALMSGGGSALLVAPADEMTLDDKIAVNRALLASGAPIGEMNTVRKCLSRIKGGQLAMEAFPAHVVSLIISDIPGDDPGIVASGPTVPTPGDAQDAIAIIDRYGIDLPQSARDVLANPFKDRPFAEQEVRLIASPAMALNAAAEVARHHGLQPLILGDALECESKELGRAMGGIARSVRSLAQPVAAPCVLLSGGETAVTIRKQTSGRGGRNTEFALALALALHGERDIWAMACDTDGIDGTEDAAGAVVTPSTIERAHEAGIDGHTVLDAHDSYSLFSELGDLIVTGPTLTNVNDLRAILIV